MKAINPNKIGDWQQFGSKSAYVLIRASGARIYKSYNTIVAVLKPDGEYIETDRKYSVTTSKHMGVFRRDAGYPSRDNCGFESESGLRDLYYESYPAKAA